MGIELAGRGITACAARLPWLDMGRGRVFLAARGGEARRAMPSGTLVDAGEIARALCWLVSADAAAVNAAVVPLDGGLSARKAGP